MRSSIFPRLVRHYRSSVCTRSAAETIKPAAGDAAATKLAVEAATATAESTAAEAKQAAPPNPLGSMMFPWERAVLDGERVEVMSTTTKLYWLVFGTALVFVMGSRGYDHYKTTTHEADPEVQRRKQEALKQRVQSALEGKSFLSTNTDEDPFDGLTPAEIEALVKKEAGPSGDPFEGMSPEEINQYLKNQKMGQGYARRGL